MSMLTHATITVGYASSETLAALHEPLPGDTREQRFGSLDAGFRDVSTDAAGGSKVYCEPLLAACLNYVSAADVAEWFTRLPWKRPECAVLAVWGESDRSHHVVVIADGAVAVQHEGEWRGPW